MTITADRQAEIDGALLMGPGTAYAIESFNPWTYPDVTGNDIGLSQRHGVQAGRDLLRGRRIPLVINCVRTTKQTALDAMHALVAAWQPRQADVPLDFKAGTRTYRVYGRPRLADPNPRLVAGGVIRVECRFLATDPFIYSATEQHAASAFPEGDDIYFEEYTETYEEALVDGRLLFNNAGTVDAPWTAEIVGPWVNPTVQLFDPSEEFPPVIGELALNVTLDDGEVLSIDSNRERLHIDGVPRLDLATINLNWFGIPPGSWALRVDGDSGSGTAEAWMRSTWL